MFIKTSYLNEDFTSDLKLKLQEKEDAPINLKRQASKNAINYLVKSAELFTDLGFDKQALNVINILDKFCEDNVSSEKMIDNIKEDGTPLDVNKADDDIEVEEKCCDCEYCDEDCKCQDFTYEDYPENKCKTPCDGCKKYEGDSKPAEEIEWAPELIKEHLKKMKDMIDTLNHIPDNQFPSPSIKSLSINIFEKEIEKLTSMLPENLN